MAASGSAPALTVIGEIASGGMGSVELARMVDASGERLVAVKRMHPEHARDLEFVRMFRDEIWLMGALRHPNLVGLLGWGEDEGGPYLVMEYVDGVALGRIVGIGRRALDPIPERLVAYVAARSAEGLHAAHQLRDAAGKPLEIVHRDVTPSNVLVAFDGRVQVTDFGIAKAVGKSSHTRTGIIKGKIAYMSPEYALRRPVDGRADLYSLGVVMYELLSNELPFEARTDFELLKKVAYGDPPRVLAVAPDVDPELATIVDRLLSKDPAQRYEAGAALARELEAWLERKGNDPTGLQAELADYAERHCGEKHKRLKRLLDDDADTVPDDGSGPKRPRLISLGTRTFTRFEPPSDSVERQPSDSGVARRSHPDLERRSRPDVERLSRPDVERLSRPDVERRSRPEEDRPRTRRVAVSDFPPASVPPIVPGPPAPTPVGAVEAEPAAPMAAEPVVQRASIPPPGALTPIVATRAIRRHSSAVIGGVVAGSIVALLLVVVTAIVAGRRDPEPEVSAAEPPAVAAPAQMPAAPPPASAQPPPATPQDATSVATPAPAVSSAPRKTPKLPATGKPPRPPVRVSKPPSTKGKPPCTPTSFDYPACLSR